MLWIQELTMLHLHSWELELGEEVQQVKHLPCNHEDPGFILSTHFKSQRC